jgi:chitin synthase
MSYYDNSYPHGNDPYQSGPQPPYGESQVHLTQSEDGAGHEAVNMNNARPVYPPFPGSQVSYNPSYAGSDMYGKHEQNSDFSGGFVGLAAPGTMLMQPNQFNAGYTGANDPRAYDQTRERLMRRRTVKKIALTNGNLVLDIPVPRSICKSVQSEEFTTTRYSAATCDPDNWSSDRFTLRPFLAKRETELAICMTCYNEDEQLLFRTLGSVIRNVGYLTSRTKSKTWGANGWKKVVVFIVGDGRKKANERMLKMLACYGLYSEGAMKDHVLDKEVTAHIFELTTQVIVDPDGGVEVAKCPVQLVFCLKEKNQKKINSHRWFFNAFCQQLNPNVCILLDVGTKPTGNSLYPLWKTFDKHKKVGGACGEIAVDIGKMGWRLYNPLVASQNFEYKMSNILDKPLESVMGFIGVLPGAFSAYRWKALKGRPLEAYFKGEALHNGTLTGGSFINNLYLAEDRILCFELVVKANEAWILKYVKSARATTDVPDGVAELIAQRRRWLNGSLFASMFAVIHFWRIWTSGQGFFRKIVLQLQVIYNLVQILFTWTSLANFFLAMYFLMKSATSDSSEDPFGGQGKAVFEVCQNLYIALVVIVVVASLGSRPQGFNSMYLGVILAFGTLFCLLLYCTGWTIYLQLKAADLLTASGWTGSNIVHVILNSSNIRGIVISILATFVLYLLSSLWMLDPWHMITSFLQYLFLTPTYVTILSIYSLANLHDVSWGTKGSDAASTDLGGASLKKDKEGATIVEVKVPTSEKDAQELWQHAQADLARKHVEVKQKRSAAIKQTDHQQNFRTRFLLFWLGTNAGLIIIFTSTWWSNYTTTDLKLSTNPYLSFLFYSTAALSACRALGSLTYVIFRLFGH